MLRRYDRAVFDLELREFYDFCVYAKEQNEREELREEWLHLLPYMSMQYLKFSSLNDYIDRRTGRNVDVRPTSEIISEIEELHGNLKGI